MAYIVNKCMVGFINFSFNLSLKRRIIHIYKWQHKKRVNERKRSNVKRTEMEVYIQGFPCVISEEMNLKRPGKKF